MEINSECSLFFLLVNSWMVGFGASPKQVSLLHEFKGDFIDEESVSLLRFDWKQIIGQTNSPQNHEK